MGQASRLLSEKGQEALPTVDGKQQPFSEGGQDAHSTRDDKQQSDSDAIGKDLVTTLEFFNVVDSDDFSSRNSMIY